MFRESDIPQLHSQIDHLEIHGVKSKQTNILKIQTKKQTLNLQSYEKKRKTKKLLNRHCDLQCQVASLEKSASSSYFKSNYQ